MKKYTKLPAILFVSLVLTVSAFADVKIKSRQTVSGQTYENSTYIKGKRQRSETMNGQMITVTQCDLQRDLQLMPQGKVYLVKPFDDSISTTTTIADSTQKNVPVYKGGTITTTITTKDTGERKQMFGYQARHLIITIESASSPDACNTSNFKMVQDGWYIDAAFQLDCDRSQNYQSYRNNPEKTGCQDKYQVKQIGTAKRGYAVYEKMTMFDEKGAETTTIVNEIVELSSATLSADLFDIPADYREVKDQAQLFASMTTGSTGTHTTNGSDNNTSGMNANVKKLAGKSDSSNETTIGAKKAGIIRIGLANVKTGTVGEGINPADLSGAISNSLMEYLKSPTTEIVPLEAKLPSAVDAEAKQKECDFVIFANVSHKKGSSGFGGMFGKVIAPAIGQTGIGHTGSVAGNIGGQVATTTIVSAGAYSAAVKSKDEIMLDVKVQQPGGTVVLAKQLKAKAKSDSEDIITPLIEEVAQSIVDKTSGK